MILCMVHDVRDARYELHVRPGKGLRQAVFSWVVEPLPVDGGPPPAIIDVLAGALAGLGRVAFIDVAPARLPRHTWQAVGGEHWFTLRRRWLRPPFALIATRDAARIRAMFDGHWTQHSQLGLVLRGDALPVLSDAQIDRAMEARDAPFDSLELPADVAMLLTPGTDGELVEVATRDDRLFDELRAGVTAGARDRGIAFEVRAELPW